MLPLGKLIAQVDVRVLTSRFDGRSGLHLLFGGSGG